MKPDYINNHPEILEKISDEGTQKEIQIKIRDIMIELANINAINKDKIIFIEYDKSNCRHYK